MANNSIVDYLNSQGKDSSFAARSVLAKQQGITGYQGTAEQNLQLLSNLRGGTTTQNTGALQSIDPSLQDGTYQSVASPSDLGKNIPAQQGVQAYPQSVANQSYASPADLAPPVVQPKPTVPTSNRASTNVQNNVQVATPEDIVTMTPEDALMKKIQLANPDFFEKVNIKDTNPVITDAEMLKLGQQSSGFADINSKILENIEKAQSQYRDLLKQSQAEIDVGNQLADLRQEADLFKQSYQAGVDKIEDKVIPMEFITGQKVSLEKRASREFQQYIDQEKNLLARLGLAQEARESERAFAEQGISNLLTNFGLQMQVQQMVQQQEQAVFDRTMALRADAQGILGGIIDSFEGISFNELDDQTKLKIQNLATQSGIPFDLLVQGMDVKKNQLELSNMLGYKPQTQVFGNKFMQFNPVSGDWEVIDVDTSGGIGNMSVGDRLKLYEKGLTLDEFGNFIKDPLITTDDEAKKLDMNKNYAKQLEEKMLLIKDLYTDPGLAGAVGTTPFNRLDTTGFANVLKLIKPLQIIDEGEEMLTGNVGNYIAGVQQLIDQETLNTLMELKAAGGTLGQVSEKELKILQNAATKINSWKIEDSNGKVVGYDITESKFKEELKNVFNSAKKVYSAINMEANNALQQKVDALYPNGSGDELDSILNQLMSFNNVGSDTNLATQTFTINNKKITTSPQISSRLQMADDMFYRATGKHIDVNQSFRSREQQAELYRKSLAGEIGRAAPPGMSFHEKGLAVDVTNWKEAEPYLRAFGLINDLADDKGHFSFGEFA